MSLRSPRLAHHPKLALGEALKSPRLIRARPASIIDARIEISDLATSSMEEEGNLYWSRTSLMLLQTAQTEPLKGWIAIQRLSFSQRDKPNVHLVELNDFAELKPLQGKLRPYGVIAWAPLHRGAEDTMAHLESLPHGLNLLGVSFDLDGAPEGTILKGSFVASLRALASRRLPVDLNIYGALEGTRVLDEVLELLGALDNEPEPLTLILSGLSDHDDKPFSSVAFTRSLTQLGLRPNAMLSLASLPHDHSGVIKPLLQSALEVFGASRVIWGSEARGASSHEYAHRMEHVLKALQELGASQEEIDQMFAGNAARLYRL